MLDEMDLETENLENLMDDPSYRLFYKRHMKRLERQQPLCRVIGKADSSGHAGLLEMSNGESLCRIGEVMNWTGEFTQEEFERAARVAAKNGKTQGLKNNFRGLDVNAEHSLKIWYLGMLGEIAAARCLGISWSENVGEDVGPYQVKAVHEHPRRLAVATTTRIDHLHPEQVYISVVVENEDFNVRGWAYFKELYHDDKLDDMMTPERPLEWALSNDLLRPMETLPPAEVAGVNKSEAIRHTATLWKDRKSGHYDKVYKRRKQQETIDTLKRLGQLTPELEARILEEPVNSGKTICPETGTNEQ